MKFHLLWVNIRSLKKIARIGERFNNKVVVVLDWGFFRMTIVIFRKWVFPFKKFM